MKKYIVTEDADMLAPDWLAARINYTNIKFVYYQTVFTNVNVEM